jgi:hypothetical protein
LRRLREPPMTEEAAAFVDAGPGEGRPGPAAPGA